MADTVGTLSVIITATDRATATIGRVRDSLESTLEPSRQLHAAFGRLGETSGLSRIGGWLGAAGGQATSLVRTLSSAAFPLAAGGVAAGAAALTANFARTSRDLLEGSRNLDMSVEDLGAFRNAARLAGVGADDAVAGLDRFDRTLTDANFGRNDAAAAASQMDVLGFAIRDSAGRARSGADALGDLAQAYAALNHDRNAQEEFARIWGVEALDKFLRRGREGVAELLRQGRARGVVTEDEARQGKRLAEQWDSMMVSADRLSLVAGAAMAPALGRAATAMDDLARAHGEWLGQRAGDAVEGAVVGLKDFVQTARDLYTEGERLSRLPWFRWFFDMDKAPGGNGRWWNPFGPIGSLPDDQRMPAPDPVDRATELQRMGEQRALWAAIMSGRAFAPEPITGLAPGPARRRAQDNVEPGPPPRDLLGLIGRSEGTDRGRGYNETLGYGAYTGGPRNLTGMSLDQVDVMQSQMLRHPDNRLNSSAAGRYQITQTTLRGLRRELGLNGSEPYDEGMQDRLATALAERRGLREFQQGRITRDQFQARLSQEWASIPDPRTGQGFYAGQRRPGVDQAVVGDVLDREHRGPAAAAVIPAPAAPPPASAAVAAPEGNTAPIAPLSLAPTGQGGRVTMEVRFANAPDNMTVTSRAEGGVDIDAVRVERGMGGMVAA